MSVLLCWMLKINYCAECIGKPLFPLYKSTGERMLQSSYRPVTNTTTRLETAVIPSGTEHSGVESRNLFTFSHERFLDSLRSLGMTEIAKSYYTLCEGAASRDQSGSTQIRRCSETTGQMNHNTLVGDVPSPYAVVRQALLAISRARTARPLRAPHEST